MAKNIVRWTIGHNVLPIAFDVLALSVRAAMRAFAGREIEWCVSYNNPTLLGHLQRCLADFPIRYIAQTWYDFPLPLPQPQPVHSSQLRDHRYFSGSIWKLCPPRLDIAAHELALDNDVIIWENCAELDDFWCGTENLLAPDPVRAFGHFSAAHPPQARLNSGLVGLAPGFDLTPRLWDLWRAHGCPRQINYLDEQGLYTAAAMTPTARVLPEEHFMCLHGPYYSENLWSVPENLEDPRWRVYTPAVLQRTLSAPITHFCEINRVPGHVAWQYHRQHRKI